MNSKEIIVNLTGQGLFFGKGFSYLTLMLIIPVVAALFCWFSRFFGINPKNTKWFAFGFSIVELILGIFVAFKFNWNSSYSGIYQFYEQHNWISYFGVYYAVGVSAFALFMVLLSCIFFACIILISKQKGSKYYGLLLVLESNAIGLFVSRDLFLFYVLFELMIIPLYFLIGRYSQSNKNTKSATKFLIYSLFGGLIMLIGVLLIGVNYKNKEGFSSFLMLDIAKNASLVSSNISKIVFICLFLGFAIKAPMVPLHSWLVSVAKSAKPEVTAILVAILDKVGTFGMILLVTQLCIPESKWAAKTIIIFGLISIIYSALIAIAQKNVLTMLCYASISHFGFIILGVFVYSTKALVGASFYMIAHALSIGGAFIVVAYLLEKTKTTCMQKMGGLQRIYPGLAAAFLIFGLSIIALPGTCSFISEFLVITGVAGIYNWALPVAAFGMILGAIYILLAYQRIFTGSLLENYQLNNACNNPVVSDIVEFTNIKEKPTMHPNLNLKTKLPCCVKVAVTVLVFLIFLLGIFPGIITSQINKEYGVGSSNGTSVTGNQDQPKLWLDSYIKNGKTATKIIE